MDLCCSIVVLDTEEDSHYGTSTTHTRQSELQASFANDIYRDVSQLEGQYKLGPSRESMNTHIQLSFSIKSWNYFSMFNRDYFISCFIPNVSYTIYNLL